MRLKEELYKKEQDEILQKIINIIDLDKENSITLYELDIDTEKQNKIIDLIPDIRKYFSFNSIKAVGEPHRIKIDDKVERTILYRIIPLINDK